MTASDRPHAEVTSPTARAKIAPVGTASNSPLLIEVRDARELAGQEVSIVVWAQDSISQHWIASIPAKLDEGGNSDAEFTSGFAVGEETAVWVTALATESTELRFELVSFTIIDSPVAVSDQNAVERFQKILSAQDSRYDIPLRVSDSYCKNEHRAIYLVDRLFLSVAIRLPGITVRPVPERPSGEDFRIAMADVAERENWPGRPPASWAKYYGSSHPMVEIVIPRIIAPDYLAAGELADKAVNDVLDVFAIARKSRGVPVVSLLESQTEDGGAHPRFRFLTPGYRGNLATGFLAGESPHDIVAAYEALHGDPKVRLAVAMYSEGLAEPDRDARYYRLWSMVELLSSGVIPRGTRVALDNGDYWPDGGNTNQAAPRVYELIRLATVEFSRNSLSGPAGTLYDLVRAWYGRRNATVHYGRFIAGDYAQSANPWYPWAVRTVNPASEFDLWLSAVESVCDLVIRHQLNQAQP